MRLHQNTDLFKDAVAFTAQEMNLPPIYVEKDYWVSFALYRIFFGEAGQNAVFKGGTSISKCYGWIDRFSEDIDIVVLRRSGETDNKLKFKLKLLGKSIEDVLPEIELSGITHKKGMIRKTAHTYNKVLTEISNK